MLDDFGRRLTSRKFLLAVVAFVNVSLTDFPTRDAWIKALVQAGIAAFYVLAEAHADGKRAQAEAITRPRPRKAQR